MQDIDFDEIDRAVSSAGTNTSSPAAPVELPAPTPTTATALVGSPAARRSTGRFMDVVHSSSDMRPPRADLPLFPPSRTEVPDREVATVARQEPAVAESSTFHWPDPIEVTEMPSVEEPLVEEPLVEEPVVPTSLESPFLAGAEIEKRPLGAFSNTDPSPSLPPVAEPIPEEESFEQTAEPEVPTLPEGLPEADSMTEPEPDVVAVDAAPIEEIPVGPTSITQQYIEQPIDVVESSGSIYDTEAYHQPVTVPAKKHSVVLVFVWIISLIIVGGGAGAAVYYFVLPMLS